MKWEPASFSSSLLSTGGVPTMRGPPMPDTKTGAASVPLPVQVTELFTTYGPPRTSTREPAASEVGTVRRGSAGEPLGLPLSVADGCVLST